MCLIKRRWILYKTGKIWEKTEGSRVQECSKLLKRPVDSDAKTWSVQNFIQAESHWHPRPPAEFYTIELLRYTWLKSSVFSRIRSKKERRAWPFLVRSVYLPLGLQYFEITVKWRVNFAFCCLQTMRTRWRDFYLWRGEFYVILLLKIHSFQ